MKIKILPKIILTLALAFSMAVCAFAAFEKTNTYSDGMFTDVPQNAWYASEVKNAYELGFMNGTGDTLMSPDGTMTVAQGITVASRVHAIYNQNTIPEKSGGKWYDMYVDYAVNNGICKTEDFDSYDRNIRRYEMAVLFANALPESYFAPKNDIKAIPDVNEREEYADELLMLYKAGVVLGSDDYGTFHPNNPIKRCEAAAIINRAALPENRLTGSLTPVPDYKEAFYLIDNQTMSYTRNSEMRLASGWNGDNRSTNNVDTSGYFKGSTLADKYTDGYVAINRDFEEQCDGKLTLRTKTMFLQGVNGYRMYLENTDGTNVFEVYTENGTFHVETLTGTADTKIAPKHMAIQSLRVDFDLDKGIAVVAIDEKKTVSLTLGSFKNMAKITYGTTIEDTVTVEPLFTQLYKNYAVNEIFAEKTVPYDWTGDGKMVSLGDTRDNFSLMLDKTGKANKAFEKVNGKVIFESYFYLPENTDSAYVSLNNGSSEAVRVNIDGSVVTAENIKHTFKNHIWQCIHIEADTKTGKAALYINGKYKGEVSFKADGFDSVTLCYTNKKDGGKAYFDDVKVYNIYDYADYCPVPTPAVSDDYTLLMSVCSLWREGTHYGWDSISPYDECSPLLGYYDEGIPETSDWEIKMLTEHGIDAMQYCWYTGSSAFSDPIKHPRLDWALHDGYFYAKYSNMLDFCILFENNNFTGGAKLSLEDFKRYIWDYWVEWYFRDDRYLTIDNKAVLQWFRSDLNMFFDNPKQVVDFMRQDIKNYGYDGLILLGCGTTLSDKTAQTYVELGFDGIGAYGWDANSFEPSYMRNVNNQNLEITQKTPSFSYLPCVATGRNIIGWDNVRTEMATTEQHRELLSDYKQLLSEQGKVKGSGWQGELLYFSTWNEYGEGHWLAPSGLNGFGYADEWRRAFTDAPEIHDDITPTINQKNRITHLYNDNRQPIRPWLEKVNKEDDAVSVVREYTFKSAEDIEGWSGTRVSISNNDGCLHVLSTQNDPILRTPKGQKIKADDVTKIHVRAKVSVVGVVNCFFTTEADGTESASKGITSRTTKADEFIDIYFDTATCNAWGGNVDMLRFDLLSGAGTFDIEFIRLIGKSADLYSELVANSVRIDGIPLEIPENYRDFSGDEYYLAVDPSTGIFTAANMYHEWNRFDGTLYIKTHNDNEFLFTEGSRTVLVNGKSESLAKPFYTYDHVPVVPMKFLLDKSGIEYSENGSGLLDITLRDIDFSDVIDNRKENEYGFDIPGDYEDWTPRNAAVTFEDGKLVIVPTPIANKTYYDAFLLKSLTDVRTRDYSGVEVRLKGTLAENQREDILVVYFATSAETSLSESKTVRLKLGAGTPDTDGYYIYYFDLASHEKWTGAWNQVRLDLTGSTGTFYVDYIKLVEKDS